MEKQPPMVDLAEIERRSPYLYNLLLEFVEGVIQDELAGASQAPTAYSTRAHGECSLLKSEVEPAAHAER